jgi:inositol oxygenase
MGPGDEDQLRAVKAFNRKHPLSKSNSLLIGIAYDLYSKSDAPPKVSELKPYYMTLINKYFPEELDW